jgi:hypothetical protein
MHSKFLRGAFIVAAFFLASGAATPAWSDPVATPIPIPTAAPSPSPVPTANPAVAVGVNPDESFPVVINYGEGQETRVQIYRGVMEPVGLRPNQVVTVTVSLPTTMAGEHVKLGLYDGGAAGPAADPLNTITIGNLGVPIPDVSVSGSLQFNFQTDRTLGLYRVLMTVGSRQYLLQFYAGPPRPIPVPTPNLVPRD